MQHDMPQSLLVFAVSFMPEMHSFGTLGGVAHPPPDIFFFFFYFCFLTVYMHIQGRI